MSLEVHVETKTGTAVTDLTLEDFEVVENGRKIRIQNLLRYGSQPAGGEPAGGERVGDDPGVSEPASHEAETRGSSRGPARSRAGGGAGPATAIAPAPRPRLALLVDLDNSRPADRHRVIGALQRFLAERDPVPSVMVMTYSLAGVNVLLPFSESSEEWSQALDAALAGGSRTPMRELEQQQMLTDIGDALKQAQVDRSTAASLLQALLARAQHYATSVSHDSRALIEALENLSRALAALPGPKSLLYVGEGFPMRPGEEVFDLLSSIFEDDRRFGDRSAVATAGSGDGSASDSGSTGGGAGRSQGGGAVVSMPPRTASPLLRGGMMGVDLTEEIDALVAAANAQRVSFHAISSAQPGSLGSRADIGRGARIAATRTTNDSPSGLTVFEGSRADGLQESLDYTAEATGGIAAAAGAELDRFLERMWSRSTSYYSLAYAVPNPGEPGLRRIKVRVKRRGVRVGHREAYVVKPAASRIGDLLAGALLLRTGDNPHRFETGLASQAKAAGSERTWSVSLGLQIPIDGLELLPADGALRADLQVYVLTMDARGKLSSVQLAPLSFSIPNDQLEESRGRRFAATFPLVLEEGSHEIAVGLSEASASRLSVARTTVAIGAAD